MRSDVGAVDAPEIPVEFSQRIEITPERLEDSIPEALARPASEA